MMRSIRVLFLRATERDHWINRLVSSLDPPFCHVEVEFEMPGTPASKTLASSVYANETVFLKERTFANPNYTIITLDVSDAAFQRMFQYARNAAEAQTRFNGSAMYLSILPHCFNTLGPRQTFCSAYVTSVLQAGNLHEVSHLVPCQTRPSTLYKVLLRARQQSFSTVPYKMNLLRL